MLGATTTDATIALGELTQQENMLQVTPSGSGQDCTKYDNAFRICFTEPASGTTMAEYIYNTMKKTKVAIIYDNSNDYSKGITEAFRQKFTELGGQIVPDAQSFGKDDVDFTAQLNNIKNSDAEAIFIPAYYQKVSAILQQADKAGLDLPFFGCRRLGRRAQSAGDDKALAEGCDLPDAVCGK